MMRQIVLGCGLALALAGLAIGACCGLAYRGWPLALPGLLIIAAVLIERWRYRAVEHGPLGPQWRATGERFVDPETGKLVAVYYKPATGERRYIAQ